MNRQSIYQQLRAHLAYLGLATTAEALPGQLEKARSSDIGHTEFVEQLLRIKGRGHPRAALADAHEAGQLPLALDPGGL